MLNVEYFPPRRGGVAAASTKSCEATESAADGVVSSSKFSGLNSFAELLLRLRPIGLALRATPAAPFRNGSHFYLWRVHPSSARRGIVRASSIHSHFMPLLLPFESLIGF